MKRYIKYRITLYFLSGIIALCLGAIVAQFTNINDLRKISNHLAETNHRLAEADKRLVEGLKEQVEITTQILEKLKSQDTQIAAAQRRVNNLVDLINELDATQQSQQEEIKRQDAALQETMTTKEPQITPQAQPTNENLRVIEMPMPEPYQITLPKSQKTFR